MRIVVVSDTHIPGRAKRLPARLMRELKRCDAVLHAGDWTRWSVYETFAAFAPTTGVAGNNDGPDIVRRLGLRRVVELDGCRIGIVHGHGGTGRRETETNALRAFAGEKLDLIVFGHTHIPVNKTADGVRVFNPGSPTDKRRQPLYSFGLLHIERGAIVALEHVFYQDEN